MAVNIHSIPNKTVIKVVPAGQSEAIDALVVDLSEDSSKPEVVRRGLDSELIIGLMHEGGHLPIFEGKNQPTYQGGNEWCIFSSHGDYDRYKKALEDAGLW